VRDSVRGPRLPALLDRRAFKGSPPQDPKRASTSPHGCLEPPLGKYGIGGIKILLKTLIKLFSVGLNGVTKVGILHEFVLDRWCKHSKIMPSTGGSLPVNKKRMKAREATE